MQYNKSAFNIETEFVKSVLETLFSPDCKPASLYLVDGEYPRRNIMHYAAKYNSTLIPKLIHRCMNEDADDDEPEDNDNNVYTEDSAKNDDSSDDEKGPEKDELKKYSKSDLILVELCMQVDFNGNTPIHIAAAHNSFDFLKLVAPLCLKYAQLIYNEDGLNPFLLAARFSSVKLIQLLVDQIANLNESLKIGLLTTRDRVNLKNVLHYACGRGCSNETLQVVVYLTNLSKSIDENLLLDLIGGISPLLGSVYHVAASNLTRLTTLWHLLNLYPTKTGLLNENKPILNKLDFREFTCVDCLIDSVMNLREMAPPNCRSLSNFYHQLNPHLTHFTLLLNKCIYKLLIECKAIVLNLPRIKNKWQLLEFFKLFVFMCKFISTETYEYTQHTPTFDTIHSHDFEAYCVSFFQTHLVNCDFFKLSLNGESFAEDCFILNELSRELSQFVDVILFSERFTEKFKSKIVQLVKVSVGSLRSRRELSAAAAKDDDDLVSNDGEKKIFFIDSASNSPEVLNNTRKNNADVKTNQFDLNFKLVLNKVDNYFNCAMSLKNLCRLKINKELEKSKQKQQSFLSEDFYLFKLPAKFSTLVNFLTFDLLHDLYGADFDLTSIMTVN